MDTQFLFDLEGGLLDTMADALPLPAELEVSTFFVVPCVPDCSLLSLLELRNVVYSCSFVIVTQVMSMS